MSASEDASPKKATATRENPLQKIEQLLTCSICLDRFKHPKLLPCQHTFCLACLSSYVDGGLCRLKCPECRAEHPIDPYEGVAALPANLTLAGFLDIHLNAVDATAAEFRAYVETYNLERCKICGDKAQLEMCSHCERKACEECRKTHMDSLKRDLVRLLNQVKRLSNRLRDGSAGLDKSLTALLLNGESAKAEIRDYFHRYREELRQREAHFLSEADAFVESERRVMSTLCDVLAVEATNVDEACAWTDAVLADKRKATDAELSHMKRIFSDAVNYLRSFQPDSDEMFGKKLRFSPGDDASKLPSAIANFGELMVCLPQCGNRYVPLEAHFLPKPLRMILESDMGQKLDTSNFWQGRSPIGDGTKATTTDDPYLRRLQFEEEAWNRLRASSGSESRRAVSPLATGSGNCTPIRNVPTPEPQPQQVTKKDPLSPQPTTLSTEKEFQIDTAIAGSSSGAKAPPSPSKISKISPPNLINIFSQGSIQSPISPLSNSSTKVAPSTASIKQPTTVKKPVQKQSSREKSKPRKSSIGANSAEPSKIASSTKSSETKTNSVEDSEKTVTTSSKSIPPRTQQHQAVANSKNEWAEELSQHFNGIHKNNSQASCSAREEAPAAEIILPPPENISGCSSKNKNNIEKTGEEMRVVPVTKIPMTSIQNTVEVNELDEQTILAETFTSEPILAEKLRRPNEKPPLPRQRSSQDNDRSLNEKVARIRKDHERINEHIDRIRRDHEAWTSQQQATSSRCVRSRSSSVISSDVNTATNASSKLLQVNDNKSRSKSKSRILYRSSSSRPIGHSPMMATEKENVPRQNNIKKVEKPSEELQVIPIIHYPTNSCGEWPQSERRFSRSKTNLTLQFDGVRTNPALPRGLSARLLPLIAHRDRHNDDIRSEVDKGAQVNERRSRWKADSNRSLNQDNDGLTPALIDYAAKQSPITIVGKRGAERGCMNWPRGVLVLPGGEFAVCDSANHRIEIFKIGGRHMTSFGSYGSGPGQFDGCAGVAYHPYRKQLIVTDRYNHRVQIFDRDGQFIREFGSRGTAPGQFNSPWGVAVDEVGLIYIADKDNHRVQVFDRTGRFMHMFGRLGNALGQFNHPLFIAVQSHVHHILITDSANHRVCVHAPDGAPLHVIGSEGSLPGELKLPRGITVDAQGRVIVADSGNNRVQVFAPDGSALATFGAWGSAPGQLKGVEGVALLAGGYGNGGGHIICADRENHRVQIF